MSVGHKVILTNLSESLLNSPSCILGGLSSEFFQLLAPGTPIFLYSLDGSTFTPFASCWMRPRSFSSYSKPITDALPCFPLCFSCLVLPMWSSQNFLPSLTGTEFPLRHLHSKVSRARVTHIFRHSPKWWEPFRRLFLNPIAGITFAESEQHPFSGLRLDVHVLSPLTLLNLTACLRSLCIGETEEKWVSESRVMWGALGDEAGKKVLVALCLWEQTDILGLVTYVCGPLPNVWPMGNAQLWPCSSFFPFITYIWSSLKQELNLLFQWITLVPIPVWTDC